MRTCRTLGGASWLPAMTLNSISSFGWELAAGLGGFSRSFRFQTPHVKEAFLLAFIHKCGFKQPRKLLKCRLLSISGLRGVCMKWLKKSGSYNWTEWIDRTSCLGLVAIANDGP